tara:strand:+ start:259 stop:471 length:213 start_codon:yes stop_codon:yes gene_type:complete
MVRLIWVLSLFLLSSCVLPKRYIIVQTRGETEDGHRCYHVESINGKDIDIVKLPSNNIEGEIKWIRIKNY